MSGGVVGGTRIWAPLVVVAALTVGCALVAMIALRAAVDELTRGPSPAEVRQAAATEVARRWEVWPVGRIFPARLPYRSEQGTVEQASRIGIAPRSDCRSGVDTELRAALRAAGCRAVLRATYLDALQGIVVTIGVAAFPDVASAASAAEAFPGHGVPSPGVSALAFPGTVSDRFTAAVRQTGIVRQAGPYLVMATAGQVDGRPARAVGRQRPTMFSFVGDLAGGIATELAAPVIPDCDTGEWRC